VRDIESALSSGDDMTRALAIKRVLEKEGFYTAKEKKLVGERPDRQSSSSGDLRGLLRALRHAAVMLLRSQGIPARVALGYGVQTSRRGAGSSVLNLRPRGARLAGALSRRLGWVTFDIYPERSDEPPPPQFDQGPRDHPRRGWPAKIRPAARRPIRRRRWSYPWAAIGAGSPA